MFMTADDRTALIKADWTAQAVAYMIGIGFYTTAETKLAYLQAESIWENCDCDDTCFPHLTPQEAVDEELTYWGD